MTDLTNKMEVETSMLSDFLASLPTAADLIEVGTALGVAALLSLTLHVML